MVEGLIVLVVAALAMLPLLFSDGNVVAHAAPTIVATETNGGDQAAAVRSRVIHEMPHTSAGLVLHDFEPEMDRVAIHVESWDTDFFWEQPSDGGIELGYQTPDGLARVQFAELEEIPAESIDIFVDDESTGTSEHIILSEAMEAVEVEQGSTATHDAEDVLPDNELEAELVPGQMVDLGVVAAGERVRIELFRDGDPTEADLQIATQDGLQLLLVDGVAMAFADATASITPDQIDLIFTTPTPAS